MESRIWEKKEGKCATTLAKIYVKALFFLKRGFTQIYRDLHGDAMLEPTNMAVAGVLLQKREFISRGTQKH